MPKSAFRSFADGLGKVDRQSQKYKSDALFVGTPIVAEFIDDWIVTSGVNTITITKLPTDFTLSVTPGRTVISISGVPS